MTGLVDTGWLAARLDAPAIAVVEVDTTAWDGTFNILDEQRAIYRNDNGSWTEYGSLVDVPVET